MFSLRAPTASVGAIAPHPAARRRASTVAPRAEAATAEAETAAAAQVAAAPSAAAVLEKKRSRRFKEAKAKV
jgi:hypothetical protein